jgi:hypothetical protein
LKRPSRWTSSTACWVLDARTASALQPWRHKPLWGWGNLVFSVIRATCMDAPGLPSFLFMMV